MPCHFFLWAGAMAALAATTAAAEPIRFVETTQAAGLLEPTLGMMGHGGAVGDVNNDGHVDVYVGGFCDRPNDQYAPATGPVPNMLFLNQGDGTFRRSKQAEIFARTSGAVFADLGNRGWLDLYCANNSKGQTRQTVQPQASAQVMPSRLYRNDEGRLTDISQSSGACPESLRTARNIGVLDYDGDGRLDLLVVEDRFIKNPRTALFRSLGNHKFQDVTAEVGLPEDVFGLGLAVGDVNDDGRPDFFVAHSNRLFLSTAGNRYREATVQRDLFEWKPVDNEDWPCGAAFADLNRDGRLDLVLSIHFEKARNRVYLNEGVRGGEPRFRDVTEQAGLATIVPQKCPHVEVQDFDNDGWPDIYMSAAWRDADGQVTPLIYRHQGLRNGVPYFEPIRPIGAEMVYYPAGPSLDYDRDGRLDLFLINWFAGNHHRLLRNDSPPRSWLQVRLTGSRSNRMGIGSKVRVLDAKGNLLGFQELTTGYGYASGQEAMCHFGLGDHQRVQVEVRFPGGAQVVQRDVAANQVLRLSEPEK